MEIREIKKLPELKEKFDMNLIFQVCVATPDVEATYQNWCNLFNIDDSKTIKKNTKDPYDKGQFTGMNYHGEECVYFTKLYRFAFGGIDFEFVEPLDKNPGNPYSDFLIRNGGLPGIQHIGVKIGNRDGFAEAMKEIGIEPMQYGSTGVATPSGFMKSFTFWEMLDSLGVIMEDCSLVVGALANDPRAEKPEDVPDSWL